MSSKITLATAFTALVGLASAITVLQPTQGTVWSTSDKNHQVQWSSVSTDPSSVNLVLVNMNSNTASTGSSKTIAGNVDTSTGQYTVGDLGDVKPGAGYQINLISTANNGILAQSNPFNITSSGSSSGSTGSTGTSSTSSTSTAQSSGSSGASASTGSSSGAGGSSASSASSGGVVSVASGSAASQVPQPGASSKSSASSLAASTAFAILAALTAVWTGQ